MLKEFLYETVERVGKRAQREGLERQAAANEALVYSKSLSDYLADNNLHLETILKITGKPVNFARAKSREHDNTKLWLVYGSPDSNVQKPEVTIVEEFTPWMQSTPRSTYSTYFKSSEDGLVGRGYPNGYREGVRFDERILGSGINLNSKKAIRVIERKLKRNIRKIK